jgi:hypothetical protein
VQFIAPPTVGPADRQCDGGQDDDGGECGHGVT